MISKCLQQRGLAWADQVDWGSESGGERVGYSKDEAYFEWWFSSGRPPKMISFQDLNI